jgi:phage baseplate assembly protein W|tara:strand:+ start:2942 stop:3427 length:486 start_codon:yes stop_codon:yes gene_type:complete
MAQSNQAFLGNWTPSVKSTSTKQSRKFKDIDLDFGRNIVTNDVNTVEDVIAIKRSVKNLVQTNFYERLFHPELGCGVRQLLFENYTPLTAIFLKRKIEEVLVNNEPRISLTSIIINDETFESMNPGITEDIDSNRLRVDIHFYIIGISLPQIVNVQLQRLR